jgi:hypothetical protein
VGDTVPADVSKALGPLSGFLGTVTTTATSSKALGPLSGVGDSATVYASKALGPLADAESDILASLG